jgi:hypothetical protein
MTRIILINSENMHKGDNKPKLDSRKAEIRKEQMLMRKICRDELDLKTNALLSLAYTLGSLKRPVSHSRMTELDSRISSS